MVEALSTGSARKREAQNGPFGRRLTRLELF